MPIKEEGQIKIHTENIFPIIKKAVYSDHEIFLRELISNSVDAIKKRKMASMAGECEDCSEAKIDIKIDRELKTISISDNGIGMSSEEVKKYINQVAFSSAEEFLNRYDKNKEEIIGHFGLGFYSSFMVAERVDIITKSALNNSEPIKWTCDGSPNFSLEAIEKESIGTEVILHLMVEEIEYIEPARIKSLITKYCDFMPVEINFEGEAINKRNPPWRNNPKKTSDKDYIDFYNYLYPFQGDPLLWVHLNTDYPYNLQGILYFPKMIGRADWENGEIKLFSNQVFVSDSIKEVVPRYLLPLRGVLDSTDIPLNVSRSALQNDRRVRSIGNFISKKVADQLKLIKKEDPSRYAEIWDSIAPFIKIGAMEDDKFSDQIKDLIIFKTKIPDNDNYKDKDLIINGDDKYTTIESYKNRLKGKSNKILYYTDELAQSTAISIWKSQGSEILKADTVIDTQFISWLETKYEDTSFQRVDSEISNTEEEDNKELLDKEGESESDNIRNIFKQAINNEKVSYKIISLESSEAPPTMILLPEQMRRINDIGALMEQKLPGLPDHHVLLINQKHPLISGMMKLSASSIILDSVNVSPNEKLSKDLAKHLYDMARSSIGGLEPTEIRGFHQNNSNLLASLVEKAL